MSATFEISVPDALVKALGGEASDLPRRTLETLLVECYRAGRLSHAQVGEALGLTRWETDGFLKEAQAYRPWAPDEFASDLLTLRQITSG